MVKNVFFDLDGTISDSSEGIINGIDYALSQFGINIESKNCLEKFIGPPLNEIFKKGFNFDEDKVKLAVIKYREYYSTKGLKENTLYDGLPELLKDLSKNNINIILATSKPQKFSEEILENFNIKQYFKFISGATLNNSRNQKADIIKYAIDTLNITDLDTCIMVGDRAFDILGAKENNIKSIGVTYGFGTEEELNESGANFIAHNITELKNILLS